MKKENIDDKLLYKAAAVVIITITEIITVRKPNQWHTMTMWVRETTFPTVFKVWRQQYSYSRTQGK